ncbi:hypothetical protein VULLAG_LOCUS8027 [Vulpes lagopus]
MCSPALDAEEHDLETQQVANHSSVHFAKPLVDYMAIPHSSSNHILTTMPRVSSTCYFHFKNEENGMPGWGSAVEHLPSAQVVISETRDRVLHQVPHREPASPSACISASICLCVSHE